MKKIFLLLMALILCNCGYVGAIDWQSIDTDSSNLNLYIDKDSIKNINPGEYLYAIKYRIGYKPEHVAYIKSNFNNYNIGIINSGIFDENEYRPQAVFANPRVFMKPVAQESFLVYAHRWVSNSVPKPVEKVEQVQVKDDNSNLAKEKIPVKEKISVKEQNPKVSASVENAIKNVTTVKEFVSTSGERIKSNWCPPKSGRNTSAILIVEIGADGSLQNYRFAKSSGDKLTDRSIISAVEQSSPFKEVSNILKPNEKNIDIQFVFEYKYFRKSVI